jgi:hypothetical protein
MKYHFMWMRFYSLNYQQTPIKYLIELQMVFGLGSLSWYYVFLNFEVRFDQWTFRLDIWNLAYEHHWLVIREQD